MKFHQSNLLKQFSNVTSVFTTKKSGNLAFHVKDVSDNVVKNHKLLANELSYDVNSLVHMKQIHSSLVHKLTSYDDFFTTPSCDALITNEKNRPLMVMVADCAPIIFYDPVQKVIAVAHAGRAGAFKNIVQNVVDSFTNEYSSNATDIVISIGSCIRSCCYEVGEEIEKEAKDLGFSYAICKEKEKYFLDIVAILKRQILSAGVLEKNLEISQDCSACTTQKHFSYRTEKETGRFAGIIYLKS